MDSKERLMAALKFTLAVIQLVLSAITIVFCAKMLNDALRTGINDNNDDEKIIFLDF